MYNIKNGLLPVSAVESVKVSRELFPCTATLKSSAVGRKIELSTDGVEFYTPIYDQNSATMLVVAILAPVSSVRFTGAAGDTWGVL